MAIRRGHRDNLLEDEHRCNDYAILFWGYVRKLLVLSANFNIVNSQEIVILSYSY